MGRPKDKRYWNQVTKEEKGKLKCKHCGHEFKGGVSRIKAHVDRIPGKGIDICSNAPGSVRDNEGVDNGIIAGSSNPQEAVCAMNSFQVAGDAREMIHTYIDGSSNLQNDTEFIHLWEGSALAVEDVIGSGNSGFEIEISQIKDLVDKLSLEEEDIKGQLQWLESRGKKRKRKVDDWLEEVADLKERAREMIELLGQGSLTDPQVVIEFLTEDVKEHMEQKPLVLSNELVGESFAANIEKVLDLLRDDKVFIIGIHGMGGVGKTTLVTHIKNHITRKGILNFKHVFWVSVSQDFSIFKLQNDIAKRIGVNLDEYDEIVRAEILSSALEEKEKSVLILDNVWNNIDLQKVGIPLCVNGIKLILTSRLLHVFQQMDCPPCNRIKMELLSDEEAWELFLLKLGYHGRPATLPPEVEKIAKSVAKECGGLPLGINVTARTMKEVEDIHQWRHALDKLRNSIVEDEVFKVLKLSYDHLMDKNMKKWFLYCALYYPHYPHYIKREEMVLKFVEEGMINGMRSLKEMFDEGHTLLDKLIGHSLFVDEKYARLRMHGLVRGMACHIIKKSHKYMVKRNQGLTRIPHMQEWTADLEKVSLMQNDIKEIPEGTSPLCPRLSTLIFSYNGFTNIPGCFFEHMNALAVLDLSFNLELTCLPDSVSNLKSLQSLLLGRCHSLEYVPPLGELKALSKLVISGTSIKEVPQGLEMLINLKWLVLSSNPELTLVPGSVLSGLINMQYLDLLSPNVKIKVEDIRGMSMLECLGGNFDHHEHLNYYLQLRNTQGIGCAPKSYDLYLGTFNLESYVEFGLDTIEDDKIVNIGGCEEFRLVLPTDITKLCITDNEEWRCLCDALVFNAPSSLRDIRIQYCPKLERLFCLSGSCSFCTRLQDPQSFPNLERIKVFGCESMKEIFGMRSSEDEDDDFIITLPKLSKLELWNLPQLKRVCRGIIVSESPPIVDIGHFCPNVERSLRYKSSGSNSAPVVLLVLLDY